MNRLFPPSLILTFAFFMAISAYAQPDSLIRFSDLHYHSDFEKGAVQHFATSKRDTFDLFLAIDETLTASEAAKLKKNYNDVIRELEAKKIGSQKLSKKKIRQCYTAVHSKFLNKYNDNEYFPMIFKTGTYNCVSASMLYAMVFDEMHIPYEVKASSSHVYLVANPGSNSVVIETTNPDFELKIFTGEFKQQFVNYLRESKQISESDYKNKSVEEIFEEKFKEVRDAKFSNLPGFQYYNKALTKFNNNEFDQSLELCQKAYFFYPDNQVKTLLYTTLLYFIQKCNFDKVSDIDYLGQLSRFANNDPDVVVGIFSNIINHHLQYTNKEAFCDSIKDRLVSQLSDKKLIEEINFRYNLQMSYRYQNSDRIEKYVTKTLAIKGNFQDARVMMENYLQRKLYGLSNPDVLLDTIAQLEKRIDCDVAKPILHEHELSAYLQKASESFQDKRISEGEKYLTEFEKDCEVPINSKWLSTVIEVTYRNAATYYFYKGNKSKAKAYVSRGLKYVPNSRLLESAVY